MRLLRQYAEWGEIAAPDLDIPIQSIAIDSRLVGVGALFCALPGARVDGHAFLAQAAAAGAIASLVDSRYSGPDYGMHLLRCNDTLGTLQHMARQRLRSRRVPVVAVTGSVGKTTTKEFLRSILSVKWDVSATPGNANSQVGLPLYLLNEMEEPELWLLEIGISLPGEMDRLTAIAAPDCALITQVGLVHAATLGSELEIAKEKARIWARPETAMGVAPMDFPRLQEFWESYAIHGRSFSVSHPSADYALNGHRVIHECSARLELPIQLPGRHLYHNLLGAVAIAHEMGMTWEEIANGVQDLALPKGRFEWMQVAGRRVLKDAYNASEASMKAALDALPAGAWGLLGEMRELGPYTHEVHGRVLSYAQEKTERLLLVGEAWLSLASSLRASDRLCHDKEEALAILQAEFPEQATLLVKGSSSFALWTVVDALVEAWQKEVLHDSVTC